MKNIMEIEKYLIYITKNQAKHIWNKFEVFGIDYEGNETLIQIESDLQKFWKFGMEVRNL